MISCFDIVGGNKNSGVVVSLFNTVSTTRRHSTSGKYFAKKNGKYSSDRRRPVGGGLRCGQPKSLAF